ncbi:sigma-54 interaction domain-containing protein [Frisingicoccus sp.]|uniref:sigma-54 interaction domain-containing protein n=1 Tax=Frisingicoccus sp. TaxID=1918627 RepID=UPI003AB11DB0
MSEDHRYKLIFEELMDKSEDGFIVIDSHGVITDINDKYCDFLGRRKENILGHPIEQIISTTSMYDVMNRRQRGDDQGSIYMHPYIASETKGSRHTYAIANRFCIFDENEQLIGAMAQMKFKERSLDIAHEVLKAEHAYYKSEYQNQMLNTSGFDKYLGNDSKINALRQMGLKVAKTDFSVLITGETGTGKELIAKSIHIESDRANEPMVCVNCGAIPMELMESEMFGYEEGAFTSARKGGKIGKFQLANHGTLFLDEIGDLPLPLQVKLLRVLQEHEIEKVGGTKPIPVDVRIIAATRKNLQQMMEEGTFRADLYYRLAVVTIDTIPLREHPEDIMLYANVFLQQLNHKFKTNVLFSKNAGRCLLKYSWPGNVRELDNVISSAFISSDQMMIDLSDLPSKISDAVRHEIPAEENQETLKSLVNQYEADIIRETLKKYDYNITAAARHLGIERSLLYKKMKKFNISIKKGVCHF